MFLTFINRKAELNFLDERFKRKGFELIILYGRRRVGKTELIKEFIKGKQHLYFLSDKRGTESNFSRFKKKIAEFLDEPSIGLHQRDNEKLISTLHALRDIGNTLIVVEHDEITIRSSDWIVDLGPGAGIHGGRVVVSGTLNEVLKNENSNVPGPDPNHGY